MMTAYISIEPVTLGVVGETVCRILVTVIAVMGEKSLSSVADGQCGCSFKVFLPPQY